MPKITLNEKSIRKPAPEVGQTELWDNYVPGFGLRISAGGARTYFVMRRVSGRMVRRSIGKAPPLNVRSGDQLAEGEFWPADARERARGVLNELARGIDAEGKEKQAARLAQLETDQVVQAASEAAARTFSVVAAAYFADQTKRGGARLRSKAELERKVRVDLSAWADLAVDSITKADVKTVLKEKAATSPVSANRLLALIRRIMRWAAREDLIAINPAADVDPPAEETERDRVLTLEELARIWAASDVIGYPFGPIVKLLILTAQRRGEVAGIRRSEIDGTVWRLPDDRAKRGKGHLVPLSPLTCAELGKLSDTAPAELVFNSGRAALGEDKTTVVSGWSRAKRRLDAAMAAAIANELGQPLDFKLHALPYWTLHDIRRSVSTHLRDGDLMGEDRVERLVISKILNHAEGGMTRIYDRYSADPEKRAALEAWGQRIERLMGLNIVHLQNTRVSDVRV